MKGDKPGDMKGDKLGRQGGSGITIIWRFRKSATQSLRSKNPYGFQLSGEKTNCLLQSMTYKDKGMDLLEFCVAEHMSPSKASLSPFICIVHLHVPFFI